MPSWGYWTLAATVAVALVIMIIAFFITRHKINKIRDEFLSDEAQKIEPSKALERGNDAGQLLWDLKEKTKNPLDDVIMEYTINTLIRNDYKKIAIIGGSEYEKQSLIKIAGAKIANKDLDYILIMDNDDVNKNFDAAYASLRVGGMISVAVHNKKSPHIKKLREYLKTTGIRHDFLKVSKGIILVVK